jgi:hypothetical protein
MYKKGDIWISAILYFALGVVLLSIILAAGLPAINRMKDDFTVKQTKDLMINLDGNIRTVYHEGPGSQRIVNLDIGRGEFLIKEDQEVVEWSIESSALISEVGIEIQEGNLFILTEESHVSEKYIVNLKLNYTGVDINLTYGGPEKLFGEVGLSITNGGESPIKVVMTQL